MPSYRAIGSSDGITVVRRVMKRRKSSKKKSLKQSRVLIPARIPFTFFPQRKTVRLRYMQSYYYNGDDAGSSGIQIKLNSLYSPEGALTTVSRIFTNAQPYYFDQIAPMYDNYVVTKATVKAVFTSSVNATYNATYIDNSPILATLRDCDDNSTVPTDAQLECMRPNCARKVGNASNPIVLSRTFNIPKLAGLTYKQYIADPNNWGGSYSQSDPYNIYYANAMYRKVSNNAIYQPTITIYVTQVATFIGPTQVSKSS